MSESSRQQIDDGSDEYGQAVGQTAGAVKQAGAMKIAGSAPESVFVPEFASAPVSGCALVSGSALVHGSAPVPSLVTAPASPWGAVLSAAWSLRHTVFKILVCVCLFLLFLVAMLVSLPSVVFAGLFELNGLQPKAGAMLEAAYMEMSDVVSCAVEEGYERALARVEQLIADGGYDRELSMEALVNYAQGSAGYDVCYILAAYSASMEQQNVGKQDMKIKLEGVADNMFPVTWEVKEREIEIPVDNNDSDGPRIATPEAVVPGSTELQAAMPRSAELQAAVPRTAELQAIIPEIMEPQTTESQIMEPRSTEPRTTDPQTAESQIMEPQITEAQTMESRTTESQTTEPAPATAIIEYLECTIHPFDDTVILGAFGLDLNAMYDPFTISYGQAIGDMANALKRTLYETVDPQSPGLLDTELAAFVNAQNCGAARKTILITGLSLVGKVPYFWGGKSAAGWNDEWNIPRQVTAEGSPTTGTIRPYGLDCSGFTAWVYSTAFGADIGAGTSGQFANTVSVSDAELLPGDLGFLADPAGGYSHVLIFAGYAEDGQRRWLHSTGGEGVVLNTPGYEGNLILRRPSQVDFTASEETERPGVPALVLEVEVTHYCACSICCGSNADGMTASGKRAAPGMAAMSSYYPFGTQIVINGRVYTVEDRGGSGIENDIHRVDIYVPDHNQALRMGRYWTTATIYRKEP